LPLGGVLIPSFPFLGDRVSGKANGLEFAPRWGERP
jgi:hypothetical protein